MQFGESSLSCLLYADDLVILAENEETMQALLKKVGDWCSVWGISVNSNKSAVLHFRQPTLPLTDACNLHAWCDADPNCEALYLSRYNCR